MDTNIWCNMAIRNRHVIGSYLMQDDESGFVHYSHEMRQIWDGTFRHWSNFETRQPQEFVKAGNDPRALVNVRIEAPSSAAENVQSITIGQTNIPTPDGPASHLFGGNGIEFMKVEDNSEPFIVA